MASIEHDRRISEPRSRTLEELYELHAPALRRRCQRLTHDPDAAEDLMQEVFARFLARFPEVPAGMHVAGYLHATARNVLWKQLRDEHDVADGDIERSAGSDDDLEVDPERSLLLEEQQSLVRRCSAALTGRQRRALTLREVEGHSYAEIGSDLGIGTDAVAQVVSRARIRLRVAVRRAHVDLDQLAPECRALLGPLSDYLDGRAAKDTAEIEAHLAHCRSCRDTLASFRGAGSRLRGTLPLAPVAGILARIGEAVRLAGGAPADAVRAGAVAVAAAVAIGGGGTYVAHELTSSPGGRAAPRAAPSRAPLRGTMAARAAAAAAPSRATPAAVHGRRPLGPPQPTAGPRAPRAPRRSGRAVAIAPTVSNPTATPIAPAPRTPAAPPSGTPSATPAAVDPAKALAPVSAGAASPVVSPPVVGPTGSPAPVTGAVAVVTDSVGKKVVQPVVTGVVQPVVDNVVAPATKRVAAVAKVVAPVTAAAGKVVAPITGPVVDAVRPVADPVVKAVAPVLPTATSGAAPLPAEAPAAPASSSPVAPTPVVATPPLATPVVTIPSIRVPGLG
jgi:RNA polymerase sigma factor (sigma-70 family)